MREMGELTKELKNVNSKLEKEPKNKDLLVKRAEIKRNIAYLDENKTLSYEAIEDLNSAIELFPHDPLLFLERGVTHYSLNLPEEAIEDYTISLKLEKSSRAYYNRGVAKWHQIQSKIKGYFISDRSLRMNAKDVITDYKKAIGLNKNFPDALYNLGIVHMRLNNFERAINCYSKAAKISPKDYLVFFNRGVCYENLVKPRYSNKNTLIKAISDYSTTIDLNPDYIPAYFNRALCYEHYGDTRYSEKGYLRLALKDYDHIVNAEPKNEFVYFNRGWAYEKIGELENALRDFKKHRIFCHDAELLRQVAEHIAELEVKLYG